VKTWGAVREFTVERDEEMYHITLSEEQFPALLDLLQCSIPEILSEIIPTDDRCLKETLKNRRHALVDILNAIQALQPAEKASSFVTNYSFCPAELAGVRRVCSF
jgi:hypothetical protein